MSVVVPVTESGSPISATTTSAGQSVQSPFQGWKSQIVTVQVTNNALGPVTVNLLGPDGNSLATVNSSATNFSLPAVTLSATGTHDVVVQPSNPVTGSVTVSLSVWLQKRTTHKRADVTISKIGGGANTVALIMPHNVTADMSATLERFLSIKYGLMFKPS